MAYGKIKADTLIYDNSGSDTEVTVASLTTKAPLASPTFTGTAVFNDLTVNGTNTVINTTTLQVEDKNIELGKVSSPSDTTADGGGITLKGASDKTFNWVDATDAWTSSEHIHLGDNKKLLVGTGSDLEIYHDGNNSHIRDAGTGSLFVRASIFYVNSPSAEDMITATANGAVTLYHDNSAKLATTAAGVTVTGTVSDSLGNLRLIPYSSKSSAYTLVAADAGKTIYTSSGGVTVPSGVMNDGTAITIINNSGSDQTITQGSNATMYNTADATTGNRTLAGRGMCTIYWPTSTNSAVCYISGAGLS